MLDLLRAAGPLASVNVAVGVLSAILALVTLVLSVRRSSTAGVASVLCLLLALTIVALGFAGHALALHAVDSAMANAPRDQQLMLLRAGTIEARANLRVALACVALPLLAGVLGVLVRRRVLGLVVALAAASGAAALAFAVTRPLPSTEPQLATVPGLELPQSQSPHALRVSARLAVTSDGAWLDGARSTSLAQALDAYAALEPGLESVPVLVDRRVRFGAFVELLEAASARGWHSVQLVVQAPAGRLSTLTVRDAPFEPGPNPMLLTLFITPQAFELGTAGARLPALPRDARALGQRLAEIKTTFPTQRFLRIGASPDTTVAELVAALDVSGFGHPRLFDELVVGSFSLPEVLAAWAPDEASGQAGQPIELRAELPDVSRSTGIDRDALFRSVRAGVPALSACFERSKRRASDERWSVLVDVDITPEGRAGKVAVTMDMPEEIARCIERTIGQWQFPFRPRVDAHAVLAFSL